MCLSKVYDKKASSENVLLNNIQKFVFDGDSIIFTDLMEQETRIQGKMVLADLVNGKVIVDTTN